MGRPKIYKHGREEIGCYLNSDEFNAFEEIRWRERKGKTDLAREAILEYIKAHAEGNSTFVLDKWQTEPDFQAIPTLSADQQKWVQCYKNSNEKDRTNLRIQVMNLQKWFRMVDINQ